MVVLVVVRKAIVGASVVLLAGELVVFKKGGVVMLRQPAKIFKKPRVVVLVFMRLHMV